MEDSEEEIAVVGIGCNFPGGEGLGNYWKVLFDGTNCAVQIPEDRFDSSFWYDPDSSKAGKTHTAKAALIDGLNEFDHKFFGITEAEADSMDPQQKLLLECTYRALENAGIPMEKASATRTGVYIGLMNRDYEQGLNRNADTITHYNGTGTAMSIAANRISYTFNFTGPSLAIDSACSSSLVALHLAAQAIRQGDCEMAVCGGVSCILEPRVFVALSKAKMISPEGTSKPFSSRADGYGRGEGCGIVLLKPLRKALQDHDNVWGIISKTAVNQDGRSVTPITKPSMIQQEELLHRIYSAEIDPSHVQYIEAHGTGTPVGDPTEAGSISRVIAKARPPGSEALCIGSVKGNIGHTESAAGVAGLIKVLLMMHHETIVPSLFYSEDGASIDAKALNLRIPTTVEKWEKTGPIGRAAGINNFGFGGTNAHAIVREYIQSHAQESKTENSHHCFVLSAASEKSIAKMMEDTAQTINMNNTVDLNALVYTSACRRSHLKHKYRKVFLVSSLSDLQEQLNSALKRKLVPSKADTRLVFVFCGNGVTYRGMCKQLLKEEPIFREKVKEVENIFQKYTNMSILQKLENGYDNDDHSKPDVVQPLLFAVQVAIASLLKHWGVRPDGILGHSVGEVAAAHCSGLLSLEDAVKVIHFRSTLQSKVTGGKMLVVSNIAVSEIQKLLHAYSGKVCLAACNSPQSCTLSGNADAVDSLHQTLKTSFNNKNLFLHILDVPAAYHSYLMDPILTQIEKSIGALQENKMEAELFSTVTGQAFSQGDFSIGKYWARNVREPVAFEHALQSVAKDKKNIVFVEIGPRRALQRNIMETLGNDITVFSSVQPDKDTETLLNTVSKLFELGVTVNWPLFYKGCESPPTPFPRYQFDCLKQDVISDSVQWSNELKSSFKHPLLARAVRDKEFWCNLHSDEAFYISEHKNNGVVIVPGALYVELGLATYIATTRQRMPLSYLRLEVSFQNPFIVSKNSAEVCVKLEHVESGMRFKVHSPLATYASGSIDCESEVPIEERNISLDCVFQRCQTVVKQEQVYSILFKTGFQYSSVFRGLDNVHYGDELKEAASVVKVPDRILCQLHDYCIHPVVLDYFLQLAAVVAARASNSSKPGFPTAIGSMTVLEPLQKEMVVYIRETNMESDFFEGCGCFTDKTGNVLVELKLVRIKYLGGFNLVDEYFFHNKLTPISEDADMGKKPKALVFADAIGISKALQHYLHPKSHYIPFKDYIRLGDQKLISGIKVKKIGNEYKDLIFMWGIQDLGVLKGDKTMEKLVSCCEAYRQLLVKLKEERFSNPIRVVTYRLADRTVDYISPGFVLPGMVRSCAAEISELSFQWIDVGSSSAEDIRALGQVIHSYPCKMYPEIVINKGQIYRAEVAHTPIRPMVIRDERVRSSHAPYFALQTADAYKITSLSAVPGGKDSSLESHSVEVKLSKICVHTSDYFPISVSDLTFGKTMYWNKHTSQNHKLLALDFSGTVTAVGKEVGKLKVGDHIVSCYPIAASSKIVIPEAACYRTKRLPFLKEVPCVSYFVVAWEILHQLLPKARQQRKMGIISLEADSSLVQVLVVLAGKSGWNAVVGTQFNGLLQNVNRCDAFIFLPPFDASLVAKASSISTTRDIVIVCDNQASNSKSQSIISCESDHVCIHTLQVPNVFQKANLKKHKTQISHWLKSLHLHKKSLDLQGITFERVMAGSIDFLSMQESESYFSTKTVSVIELGSEVKDKNNISNIPLIENQKLLFQKSSVYIVTGGLSGLGFETVKFIAQRGGGFIAILSRSAPSPQLHQEIANLHNQHGVTIISTQCDISIPEQVLKAVTEIGQRFPSCPIRGVFHSAVVLHDGLLETLDKSHFEKVLGPKAIGALNLHHATKHCELDYFVCYSSIASFFGNSAQVNYAAANSFLDLFCHYRRNLGLAGQSINWGALNLGLLLNKDHLQRFLEAKGLMVMEHPDICEGLEQSLLLNNPQQVVCKFNFKVLNSHVLSQNTYQRMRFYNLVTDEFTSTNIPEPLVQKPVYYASPGEYVRTLLSNTCNVDLDELSDGTALSTLGVDSMVSLTLQNRIFQERGVNIPLVKLLDPNSTLSTLASILNVDKCGKSQEEGKNTFSEDTVL